MTDADYPAGSHFSHTYTQPSHSGHTHHSIHANHANRANHGHPLDDSEGIIVKVNGKYDIQTLELPPQEEGEDGGAVGEGMEEVEGERERESPPMPDVGGRIDEGLGKGERG
jgi:hypothetical protein